MTTLLILKKSHHVIFNLSSYLQHTMKIVLSIKQPWTNLILQAKKTIELRTWNTKHRGEFYVHASLNPDKNKCKEFGMNHKDLLKGAIIGKCKLISVKKYETKEEFLKDSNKHHASEFKLPCYGYVLADAERIEPIEFKGRLGFWKVE